MYLGEAQAGDDGKYLLVNKERIVDAMVDSYAGECKM